MNILEYDFFLAARFTKLEQSIHLGISDLDSL
jgi:hypothetical protein